MKVETYNLSDETVIRRFFGIASLFELLIRGRLFFPTLETLAHQDPFECGMVPQQRVKKMNRAALEGEAMSLLPFVPEKLMTGRRKEDYEDYKKLIRKTGVRDLRRHVLEMQSKLFKERIVCNCWHESPHESDAMWKVYGAGQGVMVVSTIERLSASIMGQYSSEVCSPNPQEYRIAPIRYVADSDIASLPEYYVENPWLLKRKSFEHESEVRVSHQLPWVIGPRDGGKLINIDSGKLIQEIVLSPLNDRWANGPLLDAIRILVERRKLEIPVRCSDHMKGPAEESSVLFELSLRKFRQAIRGEPRQRIRLGVVRKLVKRKRQAKSAPKSIPKLPLA